MDTPYIMIYDMIYLTANG